MGTITQTWIILLGHSFAADAVQAEVQKVIFSEEVVQASKAKCLDGSPAGYFLREQDPTRWVVFLQGGGLCVEEVDCQMRARTTLGSSKRWGDSWEEDESIFSATLPERPGSVFAGWSQVFVPYCSGDMWLGADRHRRILGQLQMSGHLILDTVLEHISNTTEFSTKSREVVFSGSSAGGVGVIQHADWFRQKLDTLHIASRMVVLPLAGLFFPKGYPILFPEFAVGRPQVLDGFMARYCHMVERGFLHEGCLEALNGTHQANGTCFDVSKVLPHVKTPLFLIQNQFDRLQIHDLGLCPPKACSIRTKPSSLGGHFINYLGNRTNITLKEMALEFPQVGLFIPSYFDHDRSLRYEVAGRGQGIRGLSFKSAFYAWYHHHKLLHVFASTCDGGPCGGCPEPQEVDFREGATLLV